MEKKRMVPMSVLQRIGLENLLGEQKGKREDNRVFYNIRQRVKFSAEVRRSYMIQVQPGQYAFDDVAMAAAPLSEVQFTEDEVRRLIKLGDSIEMPVGLMDWFEPLLQLLEAKEAAGPRAIEETA
jgi:hypothetical protein